MHYTAVLASCVSAVVIHHLIVLSHSFNLNWTVTVYSFVVYMYLIVSVDCIGFDHTLFYYFIFSYFCCKHVNKRSVFSMIRYVTVDSVLLVKMSAPTAVVCCSKTLNLQTPLPIVSIIHIYTVDFCFVSIFWLTLIGLRTSNLVLRWSMMIRIADMGGDLIGQRARW